MPGPRASTHADPASIRLSNVPPEHFTTTICSTSEHKADGDKMPSESLTHSLLWNQQDKQK